MLNAFTLEYPPADLLVAAYMGVKPGGAASASRRATLQENAKLLQTVPLPRNTKTLDQMPEFLRSPEMMGMIEKMKASAADG